MVSTVPCFVTCKSQVSLAEVKDYSLILAHVQDFAQPLAYVLWQTFWRHLKNLLDRRAQVQLALAFPQSFVALAWLFCDQSCIFHAGSCFVALSKPQAQNVNQFQ